MSDMDRTVPEWMRDDLLGLLGAPVKSDRWWSCWMRLHAALEHTRETQSPGPGVHQELRGSTSHSHRSAGATGESVPQR